MIKLFLSATMGVALTACTSTGQGYMQQQQLLQLIDSKQAPVIVDVRSQGEYQAGHVPGALHIPFWRAFTTDKLEQVAKKDQLLVLYCEHGPRAGLAKWAFSLSGYEKISYLSGHMQAWKAAGLPIDK